MANNLYNKQVSPKGYQEGGKVDVFKRTDKRKGGGADTGRLGELRSKLGVIQNKIKRKTKRLKKLKSARESLTGKRGADI